MMTKNEKRLMAVVAIFFVLYNVLTFVIGGFGDHTAAFWTSYAFGNVAFVAVGAALAYNFSKGLNMKDSFFGFPILRWSVIYIGIQLVLSVYVMLLQHCSYKVPFVFGVLWLAAYVVIVMVCFGAKEHAAAVEEKTERKTSLMREMSAELAAISARADDSVRAEVEKIAEKLRFSDPVANAEVEAIEIKMQNKIAELKDAVISNNENVGALCNELGFMIEERNIKCKVAKR